MNGYIRTHNQSHSQKNHKSSSARVIMVRSPSQTACFSSRAPPANATFAPRTAWKFTTASSTDRQNHLVMFPAHSATRSSLAAATLKNTHTHTPARISSSAISVVKLSLNHATWPHTCEFTQAKSRTNARNVNSLLQPPRIYILMFAGIIPPNFSIRIHWMNFKKISALLATV